MQMRTVMNGGDQGKLITASLGLIRERLSRSQGVRMCCAACIKTKRFNPSGKLEGFAPT